MTNPCGWLDAFSSLPVDTAVFELPAPHGDAPSQVVTFFEGLRASKAVEGRAVGIDAASNRLTAMTQPQFEAIFEALCHGAMDRVLVRLPWDINFVAYGAALTAVHGRHPRTALKDRVSVQSVWDRVQLQELMSELRSRSRRSRSLLGRL